MSQENSYCCSGRTSWNNRMYLFSPEIRVVGTVVMTAVQQRGAVRKQKIRLVDQCTQLTGKLRAHRHLGRLSYQCRARFFLPHEY